MTIKMDPYLSQISHTVVDKIKPVDGLRFIEKLESSFGQEKVVKALQNLSNQSNERFSGVKEFKERVCKAIEGTSKLAGADQIYILNYVQTI